MVPSCKSEAIEWCLKEPVRHFFIVILLCSMRPLWFDFWGGFQGVFREKVSDQRVNSSAFLVCICLAVGAFTGENFAQQSSKDQKQQWFSLELIQLILQLPYYLATLDGRGLCFIHYHVKPRGASHDHLRHLIWCDVRSWRAWRVKFVMIYVMSFHVILFLELPHPVKPFCYHPGMLYLMSCRFWNFSRDVLRHYSTGSLLSRPKMPLKWPVKKLQTCSADRQVFARGLQQCILWKSAEPRSRAL